MARLDRCNACDYTEAEGSSYAGLNPGANGKVRRFGDDQLCEVCKQQASTALWELEKDNAEEQSLLVVDEAFDEPVVKS